MSPRFLRRTNRRIRRIRRIRRRRRRTRRIIIGTAIIFALAGTTKAYKIDKNDTEKIEKETGKSIDNMSEKELLKAMKKLGIKKLEITDNDQVEIDKIDEEDGNFE